MLPSALRRHALPLLILSAVAVLTLAETTAWARARFFAPPSQPTPALDVLWALGSRFMQRGEYASAAGVYAELAESRDAANPAHALRLRAQALLADGDPAGAEETLATLLDDYADSDQVGAAYVVLSQARRAANDCPGALDALLHYEAKAGPTALGPYLALQRAACYGLVGDAAHEVQAARAALAVEGGGPRLAKIEAYEKAAEASLTVGDRERGFEYYDQALQLAATPAYKAEMLFTTASILRTLGYDTEALNRFRAVVVDYPAEARAPGALDALAEMGHAASVSSLQAGLVRLNARDYGAAMALLEQVPGGDRDASAARFNHAVARLRLGEEDAAVEELRALAESDPTIAPTALLRTGSVLESNGKMAEADAAYGRLLQLAPGSERTAEALVRQGFTRYVRGDDAGAQAALTAALDPGRRAPAAIAAQAGLWLGKVLVRQHGPGTPAARDAWNKAAAAAPDSYYGLRAVDLLTGNVIPSSDAEARDVSILAPGPSAERERVDWMAKLNVAADQVLAELSADPALQRADQLLDLGLRTEATWEWEAVRQRYATAGDVAHLSALADWLADRGFPNLTMQIGRIERDTLKQGLGSLPVLAQRQVYPAGWGEVTFEQAAKQRIDPLLVLGFVRQESSFDPRARSGAQAAGLTQVVPGTAREIASKLGYSEFQVSDLYRPVVSLQFGTWYLAQQLRHFDGRIVPALAAYNAGAAAVDRWLAQWGSDPDVFVEMIPYVETRNYVKLCYENYRLYQRIYAS